MMEKFSYPLFENMIRSIDECNGSVKLGEISHKVNPKSCALYILSSLEGAIILWALNPNIDLKVVFEDNFKYLWSAIAESGK